MHAILVAIFVGTSGQLAPIPSDAELATAEATVEDVFADQVKAARTPQQEAELVRKMLETAAGSGPAGRYVLLQQAQDLASAAGDAALGMRAVEDRVAGFAAEKQQDPQQWGRDGHRLWNQADDRKGPEKLRTQLAAAECYLRAVDGLEGFQQAAVQQRLKGLGWKEFAIEFNFDESVEGWVVGSNNIQDLKVQDGCLQGRIVIGDPYIVRPTLHIEAAQCKWLEFRMSTTGGNYAQLFWLTQESPKNYDDRHMNFPITSDGQFHTYRIEMGKQKLWTGEIIKLRLDPGEWDHQKVLSESFSIDYIRGLAR